MNEAVQRLKVSLLTPAELAGLPDFKVGLAVVSPSRRNIVGPGGTADVEPRVMQVLVVLASAAGHVVTRATLFDRCWGGVYVGDDSLNRAIAAVRKLAGEIGCDSFEIETIPKTGYRLTGAVAGLSGTSDIAHARRSLSRRTLISGAAGFGLLVGGGAWWSVRSADKSRFNFLIDQAEKAIRDEDATQHVVSGLEEAVALRPGSAKAWGLLAYFEVILAQVSEAKVAQPLIYRAQEAARHAFSLDRNEPHALLAMFELEGSTRDWITRDRSLRRIIAIDPGNVSAIAELVLLLQAAGMDEESWNWNERAISLVPLSMDFLTKRALKLWIAGRAGEADKVIDQVRALYPTKDWPAFARMLIFATTGRAPAAQALLQSNPAIMRVPAEAEMWRTALAALINPSVVPVSRVREACFRAARGAGQTHGQGVMILSQLGDVDGAFAIAEGSLLGRGAIVRAAGQDSKAAYDDAIARINMQWIWTPPCAAMRKDHRFGRLCGDVGLTEYWRGRGVQPDYRKIESVSSES